MTQKIIVGLILLLTVALTVRWVVRTLRGRGGCGCTHCDHCPAGGHGGCHCHGGDAPRLPDIKV